MRPEDFCLLECDAVQSESTDVPDANVASLKIKNGVVDSMETSALIYQATRSHIPADST